MNSTKIPIVYSCSGCSSAAQMANSIAVKMDRTQVAEMSCIVGVGGDVPSLVKVAKTGRPIIALDGCALKCAHQCLAKHSIRPDYYFILADMGVQKRIHQDFDPAEANMVFEKILAEIQEGPISEKDLLANTIKIHEPFAEFLQASPSEIDFELSLLDVVRFAGHACPSMIGAFIMAKTATQELYPETHRLIRGQVEISTSKAVTAGAIGPMSNVFSMIFGAFSESGFAGLGGQFVRRNLLHFEQTDVPDGAFRFKNLKTEKAIDIFYSPKQVLNEIGSAEKPFPEDWRFKIKKILRHSDKAIKVVAKN